MVGIYKITNPTGKIYIGQSTNIKKRWEFYIGFHCKGQTKLYNSLKKYGWDNHKKEILEECRVSMLEERETFYKLYYKVLDTPSLCCRMDGKFGYDSIETRKLKSKGKLGNTNALGHKKTKKCKVRISNKMKTLNFYNNKTRRAKLSKSHSIPVFQYDLNENFIKEFESAKSATKILRPNKINGSDICACIKGRQKTAYGYKWKDKKI